MEESPQSLRVGSKVRGFIIAYGLAVFAVLVPRRNESETYADALVVVVIGLALQGALLLVRFLTARYERRHRMEGQLVPYAMHVAELAADGVSVFLFAVGTFRTIHSFVGSV